MHELTLCYQLIKILRAQISEHPKKNICRIWLKVGVLAGIDIDALAYSFPIAARDTPAEKAELIILPISGKAWCENCQVVVELKRLFDPCPQCTQYQLKVTQGKEINIKQMEVS